MLEALGYHSPAGLSVFLLLTVLLGGAAAWRTGQAVATQWASMWPLLAYCALLAWAVRFLHFALFAAPLVSAPSYLIDLAILIAISAASYRMHRTRQMTLQYAWAYERTSPFSWRARS